MNEALISAFLTKIRKNYHDEDYEKIGESLSQEYENILNEYIKSVSEKNSLKAEDIQSSYRNDLAKKRTGVRKISDFYEEHTGFPYGPVNDGDYKDTPEDDRVITTTDDTKESHRWDIVWSDEYNGKSLDSTKWSSMVGTGAGYSGDGWGNNEQEYYTDGENISFDKEDNSNCLVISAFI